MNKSFYKFVTDFGPLLVFFTFYYKNGKNLEIAIPPFILATLIGARAIIKNFETVYTSSPSFLKIMKALGVKFEIQN